MLTADMVQLTDEEVAKRVVAGDTAVFELLMRRHNERLYRVARAVLKREDEAEDVVQEAFVRAFAGLPRFEGRSSVATWLTSIAFHEALRRRRQLSRPLPGRLGGEEEDDGMPAREEDRALLTEALDSLPGAYRAVIMLRLVQGLDTRETSACLRMTEANVKVRLHRGRRLLLEALQHRMEPELRRQFSFGAARCDRVVARVLERIGSGRA